MTEEERLAVFEELNKKYSLIPLEGKKPIEPKWQRWCREHRPFSREDFIGRNAGIACGPASGIIVVDVDDPDIFEKTCREHGWELPATRAHLTGSGKFHAIFQYPDDGQTYGNKSFQSFGFDIRGEGGQVVAPGSIHPDTGKEYTVLHDGLIKEAPAWIRALYVGNPFNGDAPRQTLDTESILSGVPKGQRDETLFRYASKLRRQGLQRAEAEALVLIAARNCDPPFSEREALKKVHQAYTRYEPLEKQWETIGNNDQQQEQGGNKRVTKGIQGGNNEGNNLETTEAWTAKGLAAIIERYINDFTGNFQSRDLDEYVKTQWGSDNLSRQYQIAKSKILARHVEHGRLERTVRGGYRIVNTCLEDLDFLNASSEAHPIILPLGLSEMFTVHPKEIILVCGNSNAGKTAFTLELAEKNTLHIYNAFKEGRLCGAKNGHFYHFISEMGAGEFKSRLLEISDRFPKFYSEYARVLVYKAESIQDQIQPDAINVIDYLEPAHGEYKFVTPTINLIHQKLNKGVAVVCIQKHGDADPRGGKGVFEKPRLIVTLSNDKQRGCKVAFIEKGKYAKDKRDKDGMEADYRLGRGATQLELLSDWEYASTRKNKKSYLYL